MNISIQACRSALRSKTTAQFKKMIAIRQSDFKNVKLILLVGRQTAFQNNENASSNFHNIIQCGIRAFDSHTTTSMDILLRKFSIFYSDEYRKSLL